MHHIGLSIISTPSFIPLRILNSHMKILVLVLSPSNMVGGFPVSHPLFAPAAGGCAIMIGCCGGDGGGGGGGTGGKGGGTSGGKAKGSGALAGGCSIRVSGGSVAGNNGSGVSSGEGIGSPWTPSSVSCVGLSGSAPGT